MTMAAPCWTGSACRTPRPNGERYRQVVTAEPRPWRPPGPGPADPVALATTDGPDSSTAPTEQPAPSAPGAVAGPVATTDPVSAANFDGADLVRAVDALEAVSVEPVHAHATRYHEVHSLLQDALSATDRPGA